MRKLVFATNNLHKLSEVRDIIGSRIELLNLNDIGFNEEIPETASTLEGNASLKSSTIYKKFGIDCFADDTGLEVDALNGGPGVYSARYAGAENDADKNTAKLLGELISTTNRKAQFRTVISLILNGSEYFFEGIVEGVISREKRGNEGFGYDPVFIPDGYTKSFAELSAKEKNTISHRARATQKLYEFLLKV
ncbi:MAG: non-canonical purine NTP pyrophosphatase [Bacteroidetes bacterium HGW-Bacteroidetes-17]|jgi:XTP/dITP diphosphohydrolase|nr:MAG: non-canonical purine NTP pyrophosphatase [Bacteroidetes bacterium HGW-Bacteroidetes-17]